MPTNRLANLGYLAIGKETTKGTAVTPTVYVPLYDDNFTTSINMDDDNPIVGQKMEGYQALQGMRSHEGDFTVIAEPNTAGHLINMLLTKGTTTGSDPYTHPFTLSAATDPKSYTIDICKGQIVHRFVGVEISELEIGFDKNKMTLKCKASALASFIGREVSSVSTATVTFKTNYDPTPTTGLVASDLVRLQKASDATTQDFTISSLTSTTAVLSGSPSSIVSGDFFYIRAATPSYTLKTPFMWSRTEFRFAADASTALSATQLRVEDGSKWKIMHKFEKNEGAQRSGAFDPAALIRTQGDAEVDCKMFFDTADDLNRFLTVAKRALVIRHFSETGYEFRVTLNNLRANEMPVPMKTGEILYLEAKFSAFYDTSDAQGMDIKVLNGLATI